MQLEAKGKSVEIAISNGLLECGMKRDEVEVEVLDQGGLFKNARVRLTWGEEKKAEETPINEETDTQQVKTVVEEENVTIQPEKPKRVVDPSRLVARGTEFLQGLVKLIDQTATVEAETKDNEISFSIKGENVGKLIGFHGENLQALQYLLSGLKTRGEGALRVYLDVDGYKQNRNQAIVDLALKTAEQAVKIERNIHLDPMNAYVRRIVHTTLQGREDVTTESTGEGEKRHVVIKPVFKK